MFQPSTKEVTVCESRDWVQAVRQVPKLHVPLGVLVGDLDRRRQEQPDATILLDPKAGVGLLYRYLPASQRLFLIAP